MHENDTEVHEVKNKSEAKYPFYGKSKCFIGLKLIKKNMKLRTLYFICIAAPCAYATKQQNHHADILPGQSLDLSVLTLHSGEAEE